MLEICLLVIGLICVVCSYLFSEHLTSGNMKDELVDGVKVASITKEIVKREVEAEVANVIDEKIEAMEVKIDKLTMKKIMAMGEYSDEIQEKINQNHEEVMFLYNMLNDKEEVLKNTIRDIEALKASVKKMTIPDNTYADVSDKDDEYTNELLKSVNAVEVDLLLNEASDEKKIEEDKPVRGEINNNNQMILELYGQGKSPMAIAKELGLGVGEVRLVIDLFNSR